MAYNLRSRKRAKVEDDEDEDSDYDPDEENSVSSQNTFIEDDESYDEFKKQILNRLLGNNDEEDSLVNSNLYHHNHYEKMDNHFIDIFNKDKSEEVRNLYKEKLKNIRAIQISGYVKLEDIITAPIPDEKKAELIVLYDQLKMFQYYQDEFIYINRKIKKTMEYYSETKSVFVDDEKELMNRIKTAKISECNREKLIGKLFSLQKCDTNEKHDILSYIEYGLKIINESKHNIHYKDCFNVNNDYSGLATGIKQNLDTILFGQDKAKEEIIDNVICRMINPDIGNISVFLGASGVGKTHTARNLAKMLGYKFYQISLGAINDSYSITGSLSTYVSSRPGEIYNAIADMGCDNGIIFLDEFDKIFDTARTNTNSSLENVFLNILDPTQNATYKDNYLSNLNIDLSKIWFIISVNDLDHIRGPIKDRLRPVISFENYTLQNKIDIAKQFIIPDTLKTYKIDPALLWIEDDVYKLVCNNDTDNRVVKGIREVKSKCELLLKRFNTLILAKDYKPSYFINLQRTIDGKYIINSDVVKTLTDNKKEKVEKFMSFYS